MNGSGGKRFCLILLLASFSLAVLGAGPVGSSPGGQSPLVPGAARIAGQAGPAEGLKTMEPADAGGIPPGSDRPESLAGSTVTFNNETWTGGAPCFTPGVESTFCLLASPQTHDSEFISGLALRFPAGWTVTNVGLDPVRTCEWSFNFSWGPTPWYPLSGPNEIFLDFSLSHDAIGQHCWIYFLITAIPGAGGACDAPVSWYWNPMFNPAAAPPHYVCSSDGYTPAGWAPCEEAVQQPALIPTCLPPGLYLDVRHQSQEECPGYATSYEFTVTNTNPYGGAFPISHSGNAWPATHPPAIGLASCESATFTLTHSILGAIPPGSADSVWVTVINPADPTQAPEVPVTTRVSTITGWTSVPDSGPPWYLSQGEGNWPGCGCTAKDAAGHWVTYEIRGPVDANPGFWGYDHDTNTWFQPPEPQAPYPSLRYDYAAAYDPATNRCYFTGGQGSIFLPDAWEYDPVGNAFAALPDFSSNRWTHSSWVGTLGGTKYLCVAGGWNYFGENSFQLLATTQCYNLDTLPGSWEPEGAQLGTLPAIWGEAAFDTLRGPAGDQFWMTGGWWGYTPTDAAWYFDTADNQWHNVGPTGFPRNYPGGAAFDGAFYQLGGYDDYNSEITATAIRYEGGTWTQIADMPHRREHMTVGVSPDFLSVVDGYSRQGCVDCKKNRQEIGEPVPYVDVIQYCSGGCPAITLGPEPPLPVAYLGTTYTLTLTAIGGTAPYSFAVTGECRRARDAAADFLPPGLSLSPDGTLSGTPTTPGIYCFTVTVTDAAGCYGVREYDMEVTCPEALTLQPASPLPDGMAGLPYAQAFTVLPAGTLYTFTAVGYLPPGLSLSGNGVLSGTPLQAGTFGFSIQVEGWAACLYTFPCTLTIACPSVTIQPPALPAGTAGTPYSFQLLGIPAGGAYFFSLEAGALPLGLTLYPDGTISGTPVQFGNFTFTVKAEGWCEVPTRRVSACCTGFRTYTLTMNCPQIYFDPNPWTLPNALLGQYYAFQLSGAGGIPPYTVAVVQNALPPGLSIGGNCYPNGAVGGPEGLICGIPTAVGNYGFTLQVTDAMGCSATRWFEIYVCPPITVGPASLPSGKVGVAYAKAFTANGATAPYTFSLTGGALPPGLTLAPATGVLSGTPSAAGIYAFTVTATDKWGCQGSAHYTLIICGTVTLSPNSPLPGGQVGVAYNQPITATGGGGTLAFAITAGLLPPGITLATDTGLLSGTPLYGGTYSFTVTATFGGACTGSKAYTIPICPAITVNPATLPAGKKGTLYSKILTGAGGTAPYTFSLAGGALPTGLTLAAATGKLSGYPTAAGTYTFTVRARDSKGCTGTRAYTVVINP